MDLSMIFDMCVGIEASVPMACRSIHATSSASLSGVGGRVLPLSTRTSCTSTASPCRKGGACRASSFSRQGITAAKCSPLSAPAPSASSQSECQVYVKVSLPRDRLAVFSQYLSGGESEASQVRATSSYLSLIHI